MTQAGPPARPKVTARLALCGGIVLSLVVGCTPAASPSGAAAAVEPISGLSRNDLISYSTNADAQGITYTLSLKHSGVKRETLASAAERICTHHAMRLVGISALSDPRDAAGPHYYGINRKIVRCA